MSDATLERRTFDIIDRINAATTVADVYELLTSELEKLGLYDLVADAQPSGTAQLQPGDGEDCEPRVRTAIHVMCTCAHARVRTILHSSGDPPKPDAESRLTAREREVLMWVARGKTDWEIGEILQISKETSFAHVRNCCRKLDALTRTQAVVRAIMAGEITP